MPCCIFIIQKTAVFLKTYQPCDPDEQTSGRVCEPTSLLKLARQSGNQRTNAPPLLPLAVPAK